MVSWVFHSHFSLQAQLAAEDTVLQERLDNLVSEITFIKRYAANLSTSQQTACGSCNQTTCGSCNSSSSSSLGDPLALPQEDMPANVACSSQMIVVRESNISQFTEESWKGNGDPKKHENRLPNSKCLNLMESSQGSVSLGSCGSLADSESSPSPLIVVIDHDKNVTSSKTCFNIPTEEDDVFLSWSTARKSTYHDDIIKTSLHQHACHPQTFFDPV